MSPNEHSTSHGGGAGGAKADEQVVVVPPQDLDLRIDALRSLLETDPALGIRELYVLLNDDVLFEKRLSVLGRLLSEARKKSDFVALRLGSICEYLPELWWLATGRLKEAVDNGEAHPEHLALLSSNPDILTKAREALLEGESALEDDIGECQADTWSWLRDKTANGSLQEFRGRFIAAWRREQREPLISGDDPATTTAKAAAKWNLPVALIAVTFVEFGDE